MGPGDVLLCEPRLYRGGQQLPSLDVTVELNKLNPTVALKLQE
jgi:hypothetical protein